MDKQLPNEDLMARIVGVDEYAFQILVERHKASLLNLIYRFIGDPMKSQDLAQEVFLRVWQAAKSYEPKAKFTTWLYRIAVNHADNDDSNDAKPAAFRQLASQPSWGSASIMHAGGTDSICYGSLQWQIESMHRFEIPESMRKQ
jgi:hypothetical protein